MGSVREDDKIKKCTTFNVTIDAFNIKVKNKLDRRVREKEINTCEERITRECN